MKKQFKLGSTPHKTTKKLPYVLVGVLVVLVLASGIYWFMIRKDSTNSEDRNANDPTVQSAKELDADNSDPKATNNSTPSNTTADDVPVSTDLAVTEVNANQADGFVNASAQISGGSQEGTCVFSFETTDGRPVVKQSAGTTNCSIRIAEVEFDKLGEWNLTVTFYSQNTKASAGRKVTIN